MSTVDNKFNNVLDWLDSVPLLEYLNAELSINSGQEFLWQRMGDVWYGIHGKHVVRFYAGEPLKLRSFPAGISAQEIFRLGDDVSAIFEEISHDPLVKTLLKSYSGLRLMRQDPAQCLFSFLCASNTNIPMIRKMLHSLCERFGDELKVDGHKFHTFPSVTTLDRVREEDLRALGLGYRAKAIKATAKEITQNDLDLTSLQNMKYEEAHDRLVQVYGIGPKTADCVLLFSLEKLDAFPIDVWIARALTGHYNWLCDKKMGSKLTGYQYNELAGLARRYFGRYAGYAQQYLYYYMRQTAGRRW